MAKGDKKKIALNNGVLWGILGILLIFIVGLGVAIAIPKGGEESTPQQQIVAEEEEYDGFFGEKTVQRQTDDSTIVAELNAAIEPMSADEAIAFLDEQQEPHAGTSTAHRIEIMKVWVYINDGRPEEAMELMEQIDENDLDERQLMDYYNVISRIYYDLGDETQGDEYAAKSSEIYINNFGTDGDDGTVGVMEVQE